MTAAVESKRQDTLQSIFNLINTRMEALEVSTEGSRVCPERREGCDCIALGSLRKLLRSMQVDTPAKKPYPAGLSVQKCLDRLNNFSMPGYGHTEGLNRCKRFDMILKEQLPELEKSITGADMATLSRH